MSKSQPANDILAAVQWIDHNWQAIKELLLRAADHEIEERKQPADTQSGQEETEQPQPAQLMPENHPFFKLEAKIKKDPLQATVASPETDMIMQKVEEINRDPELADCLVKVEKQIRRLTMLGAAFSVLMTLALAAFGFFMFQNHQLIKSITAVQAQRIVSQPPAAVGADQTKAPVPTAAAPEAASPPSQPGPIASTVKYVGSRTSNKYHYPDCKWAKTILPEKVLGFKSVEEAKEEGYIRCPVCKPPLTDNPNSKESE